MMFFRLTGSGSVFNKTSMFVSHVTRVTTVSFSSDKYIWGIFFFFFEMATTESGYWGVAFLSLATTWYVHQNKVSSTQASEFTPKMVVCSQ